MEAVLGRALGALDVGVASTHWMVVVSVPAVRVGIQGLKTVCPCDAEVAEEVLPIGGE